MTITSSIDTGHNPTLEQRQEIGRLSNKYFNFDSDPEQMQVTKEVRNWFKERFAYGMNLISDNNKFVGFTFIFLSDTITMKKFIDKKINEEELSQYFINNLGKKKFDCVYLCAALIKPEYRGHGLAAEACIKQIKKIMKDYKIKKAFYWGYSEAGSKTAKNIAKKLKLPIYSRKA